jgi:hypothetical protein
MYDLLFYEQIDFVKIMPTVCAVLGYTVFRRWIRPIFYWWAVQGLNL